MSKRQSGPSQRASQAAIDPPEVVGGRLWGSPGPHHCFLQISRHSVLPGKAQDMWQVEGEVDDSTAGCGQAGLGEESAEQEALRDGGRGERQQEEEEDERVAVMQDPPVLKPETMPQ